MDVCATQRKNALGFGGATRTLSPAHRMADHNTASSRMQSSSSTLSTSGRYHVPPTITAAGGSARPSSSRVRFNDSNRSSMSSDREYSSAAVLVKRDVVSSPPRREPQLEPVDHVVSQDLSPRRSHSGAFEGESAIPVIMRGHLVSMLTKGAEEWDQQSRFLREGEVPVMDNYNDPHPSYRRTDDEVVRGHPAPSSSSLSTSTDAAKHHSGLDTILSSASSTARDTPPVAITVRSGPLRGVLKESSRVPSANLNNGRAAAAASFGVSARSTVSSKSPTRIVSQVSGGSGGPSINAAGGVRTRSRSPIHLSPNRFAAELRQSLPSKSPTRPHVASGVHSGATMTKEKSHELAPPPVISRKMMSTSSVNAITEALDGYQHTVTQWLDTYHRGHVLLKDSRHGSQPLGNGAATKGAGESNTVLSSKRSTSASKRAI